MSVKAVVLQTLVPARGPILPFPSVAPIQVLLDVCNAVDVVKIVAMATRGIKGEACLRSLSFIGCYGISLTETLTIPSCEVGILYSDVFLEREALFTQVAAGFLVLILYRPCLD